MTEREEVAELVNKYSDMAAGCEAALRSNQYHGKRLSDLLAFSRVVADDLKDAVALLQSLMEPDNDNTQGGGLR